MITATLGVTAALLIDAGSFAVLTVAALLVRARRPPAPSEDHTSPVRPRGGYGLIFQSPVLRVALTVSAIAVGCAVVDNVAAPFRFINQLGASGTVYGTYLTLWGVGAFIGVQILPRLPKPRTETALAVGNLLIGAGIAGIGVAPNVPVAFAASVAGGIGNGLANVAQSALIAANTPASHRGRVFASAGSIVQGAIGIGTVAGAPLVAVLTADRAMILAGCVCAVVAAGGLTVAIRRHAATDSSSEPIPASPS